MFLPLFSYYNYDNSLFEKEVYQQKISISEKNISLKELLNKLGAACDTRIEVSKNISDCRLKLKVKGRSLSEIFSNIETLYDGEYKKIDNKIYFSLTKQRNDQSKAWWKAYNKEREIAIRQLSESRRKAFDTRVSEQQADNSFTEVTFWKKLPDDVKDRISNDLDQRYFYKLKIEEPSYRQFQNSVLMRSDSLSSTLLSEITSSLKAYQSGTPYAESNFANVSLNWSYRNAYIATIVDDKEIVTGLQLSFSTVSPEEEIRRKRAYSVIQLDHRALPKVYDKEAKIPKGIKELVESSKGRFWEDDSASVEEGNKDAPVFSRNNVLDCLAEKPDFEFISDIYYQPETLLPKNERSKISLDKPENVIKKYRVGWDVSVRKKGDITLVRNNRWYRDDYLMPDIKVSNSLVGLYSRSANIETGKEILWDSDFLRQSSQVIKSQSLFQISNGFSNYIPEENTTSVLVKEGYAFPLSQISDFILSKYELLDFIQSLDDSSFKGLISDGIRYGNLTDLQREKLAKVPSSYITLGTSPNAIVKLKVINSSGGINITSINAGIMPRLSSKDYIIEIVKQ